MALRFRCEHCGKRLQVEQQAGESVMCPYCRNVVVVPADAQAVAANQQQEGAAAEGEEEVLEEGESTGDRVVAFLATYLPSWGTSVVLHLALVLVALATYTAFQAAGPVEYKTETVTKEVKRFIKEEQRSMEKSRTTRRAETKDMSSFVFKTSENPVPDVADNRMKTIDVIGIGGGGQSLGGMAGFGAGRGGGGGAEFFGVGGVARKIVFVVDRSGSMTDSIMYVKYELKRSIRTLRPNQSFYVVFYSTGPAVEMPSRKLVPATEANKQMAYEFIDSIVPIGQTDPSDALKRAFEVGPELIYLLTDGEFDRSIVGLIDKLNGRADKVTVNTICFIYSNGEGMLQQIAQKNNGIYKYVAEDDLQSLGQ